MGNARGVVFLEYVILALVVLLATVAFFSGGGFATMQANVESVFEDSVNKVLAP